MLPQSPLLRCVQMLLSAPQDPAGPSSLPTSCLDDTTVLFLEGRQYVLAKGAANKSEFSDLLYYILTFFFFFFAFKSC